MKTTLLIRYAIISSVLFLLLHIVILRLQLSDTGNFLAILDAMIGVQLLTLALLQRTGTPLTFKKIVVALCLTQTFGVLLLTLYSAWNPMGEPEPINPLEVVTSLALFAGVLPVMLASLVWFTTFKQKGIRS